MEGTSGTIAAKIPRTLKAMGKTRQMASIIKMNRITRITLGNIDVPKATQLMTPLLAAKVIAKQELLTVIMNIT